MDLMGRGGWEEKAVRMSCWVRLRKGGGGLRPRLRKGGGGVKT